jgi:SSS family solute:Na+ symporter
VLAIGLCALGVAAMELGQIIELLKFSFGLRAAGPFVPFIAGHFWKGGTSAGSLAAIIGAT